MWCIWGSLPRTPSRGCLMTVPWPAGHPTSDPSLGVKARPLTCCLHLSRLILSSELPTGPAEASIVTTSYTFSVYPEIFKLTSSFTVSTPLIYVVVQSLSCAQLFTVPWTAACQTSLSFTICWGLLKVMSIVSVMPSNHLILCHPLLLLPSIFPSIRVFSSESVHHIRWPKYGNFSFTISPFNEYSGLISFRIDWFDLAIQGTLKGLLPFQTTV